MEDIRRAGSGFGVECPHLGGCASESGFLAESFDALDALEFEVEVQVASVGCHERVGHT